MAHLYFDIETLPAPEEKYNDLKIIFDKKKQKDNLLDKETNQTFDHFVELTALTGAFGQLFCIGYALNDEPAEIITGSESEQLRKFWDLASSNKPLIGHNILQFDIPFLIQRSVILGVKHNFVVPKPWEKGLVFDTMVEWSSGAWNKGWNSLDVVARALSLPTSKDKLSGSQVNDFFKNGQNEDICSYCKADVELTRKIYKKLTFSE
jgi:DNA polymerase elongation subunit (family B)